MDSIRLIMDRVIGRPIGEADLYALEGQPERDAKAKEESEAFKKLIDPDGLMGL